MRYQFKREDAFMFVDALGFDSREKGDELEFRRCPYCRGGEHRDEWTFSVNMESGAFKCLRASCDRSGHFVQLCRDFGYRLDFEPPKIYKRLEQRKPESTDAAIRYLQSRGISAETTRRFRITTQRGRDNVLVFPFYDDDGTLTFVKYRNTTYKKGTDRGSKEWSESNTMPILFGMNLCNGFDRLIITEGQIDTLSVAEAGIENVVSVPTGATGFTWLTHCWKWITQFREIIVFGDCEHGKITLLDTLKARLPKEIVIKAVRVQDYLGEKDANDILRSFGVRAVRECIEYAEIPSLSNVKQLADVKSVDINKLDKITTGITELDRTIRGMAMGQLIILTGKRGEGKSTLMSQIICDALDQNRTVFAYSGELADFHFKRWIDFQLAGSKNIGEQLNKFGDVDYTLDSTTVEQISEWYRNRAYIYDNSFSDSSDAKAEMETLPDTIEKVILQYNAQLICIDNLMTAMERVTEQNNLYLAQSNFVGRLKAIAQKYSVVIILVAHPRKSIGGEQDANELVAGSADITNKADIVIKYQRNRDDSVDADGVIEVTKNRLMGTLRTGRDGAILTRFSPKTKRVFDVDQRYEKVYGWKGMVLREGSEEDELPF